MTLLSILFAIVDLLEVLFFPLVFLIAGLLLQLPWQYYAITIGGYFALFFLGQLLLHLILKKFDKTYSRRFTKKLETIISKFSAEVD